MTPHREGMDWNSADGEGPACEACDAKADMKAPDGAWLCEPCAIREADEASEFAAREASEAQRHGTDPSEWDREVA